MAQDADDKAGGQCREESRGGHVGGGIRILSAQFAGDEIAASVPEKEADGLNDCHHGEHNAHGAGGGIALEETHKEGISHVVECGDQHADDAGDGLTTDGAANGRFGHFTEFSRLFFIHGVSSFRIVYNSSIASGAAREKKQF